MRSPAALATGFVAALAVLVLGQSMAQARSASLTVVELFTSQGCSSCPPADALFHDYATRPDLVALSLSVDYWDYLGWKDTLANPRFTARQRAYAAALGIGNVYTPQLVVGGIEQAVGSNREKIDQAIEAARRASALTVADITARLANGSVTIEIGNLVDGGTRAAAGLQTKPVSQLEPVAPSTQPGAQAGSAVTQAATSATVWFAVVSPKVEVVIRRGENVGRTQTYYNVVRSLTPIGTYSGTSTTLRLPQGATEGDGNACAVLVQEGQAGRVLAAAWMTR